ncbi:MAG: family 16 glycosylhydrolase [Candidatus Promineifilaceae bacterium]|nr:family 16 glycosylhydrolase [Candidatus Promineifilaceae bacterium]
MLRWLERFLLTGLLVVPGGERLRSLLRIRRFDTRAPLVALFLLWGALLLLASACTTSVAEPAPPEPTYTPAPTHTPAPTATPDPQRPGWELLWHDEFDEPDIDEAFWTREVGGHGWGNGEAQYYTDRADNASIEDGYLVIRALEENMLGKRFTSARLMTRDKVEVAYGRIEARIQLPHGQGLWPAFWMLGANLDRKGWPHNGEIDIVENRGSEPYTVHGTVHGPGYSGGDGIGGSYRLIGGERYADDFHVFAIEWAEEEIRWYVDDEEYFRLTPEMVPGEWVYDHPFFIILNVAVGGRWPGYPDETTTFPQTMKVDYVRVYKPAGPGS